MTRATRYVAQLATLEGSPVSAGFVTIDDSGRPLHREALSVESLERHGWHHRADASQTAQALAGAAEAVLADLGYARSDDLTWAAQLDPAGRWATVAGADLRVA